MVLKKSGDIINIMGDDDRYENEKYSNMSDKFSSLDYIYGDTIFIKDEKNVRLYSLDLNRNFMNIGYIPSHTSLFLKKKFMI